MKSKNKFIQIFNCLLICLISFSAYNSFSQTKPVYLNSYHWVVMEKISVKEFVEELKINENDSNNIKILTTIGEQDTNWITKEDVPYLFTLINSEVKAKCIMQSHSSYISSVKPTLSDHAILLIETYKNRLQFPNKLNHCTIYTSEKKEELINWWIEEKDK